MEFIRIVFCMFDSDILPFVVNAGITDTLIRGKPERTREALGWCKDKLHERRAFAVIENEMLIDKEAEGSESKRQGMDDRS